MLKTIKCSGGILKQRTRSCKSSRNNDPLHPQLPKRLAITKIPANLARRRAPCACAPHPCFCFVNREWEAALPVQGPASSRQRAEEWLLPPFGLRRKRLTRAPARGLRQLAAAFAAKPPMLSALLPGVTAAPAMRERCVRACWACALLIPTSPVLARAATGVKDEAQRARWS